MRPHTYFFTFIIVTLGIDYGICAEYVPAYIWGTTRLSDRVSALHKTSEDSFRDALLEYSRDKPYIIVFAEQTLSPEDFAQRNANGDTPFKKLSNLKQHNKASYDPHVENPLGAVKNLGAGTTELSIKNLIERNDVPQDNILIIDLDDVRDQESRFHMLRRHDSDIVDIYNDLAKQHENILAIYTGRHVSWVEPEESVVRKSRSLLAADTGRAAEGSPPFKTNHLLLYFNPNGTIYSVNGTNNLTGDNWAADQSEITPNGTLELTLTKDANKIEFRISHDKTGYWYLNSITVLVGDVNDTFKPALAYAPLGFSYHCGQRFVSDRSGVLDLKQFQLQYFNSTPNITKFGDAYNCVGFTSIPIWSGLFVTFILLFIITFGLTMMMDIKTMDRFDDAKGKTITVNVAE